MSVRFTDFTRATFESAVNREADAAMPVGDWLAKRGGRRHLAMEDRLLLVALRVRRVWIALPSEQRPDFGTYLAHSIWAWRDKRVSDYQAYRELRRIYERPEALHLKAPSSIWRPDNKYEPQRRIRYKKAEPLSTRA